MISRAQLALQYAVVLIFTYCKGGYERLILPLCLNTTVYATSTIIFGGMSAAFLVGAEVSVSIVSLWWVIMFLEGLSTITISCSWRMLSFKATHLVERMGLLTLIVIGEGAIGVTKTVSKLLGKSDTLDSVAIGQIISIILILLFLWSLYFDNQPHGHYGTIKQQIWSVLHFPFHLAIVGVAEGSQQIAQTRAIIYNISKFVSAITKYCVEEHLDGEELGEKLNATVAYYQFDGKIDTKAMFEGGVVPQIQLLTSSLYQGVCSEANVTLLETENSEGSTFPAAFNKLTDYVLTTLFSGMGIKLDPKMLAEKNPETMAWESFDTVYLYWWSSLAVLLLCYMSFLYMIRRHKADFADYFSQITRGLMAVACICAVALGASNLGLLHATIETPFLLPIAASILAFINYSDKLARQIANKRITKSDRPVSSWHWTDHHGKPHYEQLHDPEKDADIKGMQLRRQPPLEVIEMDSREDLRLKADTSYVSVASLADPRATQPRNMIP